MDSVGPDGARAEEPATATTAEPGRGQSSAARHRLHRRAGHRVIAGVAGGLADYTGGRPLWFRLAFVGFTLLGGIGLLVYVLLWWLFPREDLPDSAAERLARRFPNAPSWLGIALLLLGVIFLANQFGLWRPNIVIAFLLIGLGLMLFMRDAARPSADAVPLPGSAHRRPADPGRLIEQPAAVEEAEPPQPRPRRERSGLAWLTLGTSLLAVAVLVMLAAAGRIDLPLVRFPAVALFVLGCGLLVGTFVGRARWLILPGLLLVPLVLGASLIRVPLQGGIEDLYARPRSAGDLARSYHRIFGTLTFDLRTLPANASVDLTASTGFGEVQVLVPRDARLEAAAEVGFGYVSLGRAGDQGLDLRVERSWKRDQPGPTITLHLSSGIGSVSLNRFWPEASGRQKPPARAGGGDRGKSP